MKQAKRILFPVDLSPHCERVGREVFAMAKKLDAQILALHVIAQEEQSATSDERLARFIGMLPDGVKCRQLIVRGNPAREILASIERERVDFVTMPTRGLGLLESLLFGSVTERVLHRAQCPVWTEGQNAEGVARIGKVLCAVDLGPLSAEVVEWAGMLASQFQVPLSLMHVGHGDGAVVELRHLAERVGVEAECVVRPGEVVGAILQEAELSGADLLVIGRGAERQLTGRFRSHAQSIIRECHCGVLSV